MAPRVKDALLAGTPWTTRLPNDRDVSLPLTRTYRDYDIVAWASPYE